MASIPKSPQGHKLDVAWWNLNDFYHFDPDRVGKGRWPRARRVYDEKCRRVDRALKSMFASTSVPEILALAEVTKQAAQGLRDRLLPGYNVTSLDSLESNPTLQVAILTAPAAAGGATFSEAAPIVVPGSPRGTRPMAVLNVATSTCDIRLIACHWQAQLDEASETTRFRIADHLGRYIFEYLSEAAKRDRGVVVVGDLNEEPFNRSLEVLNAHRHRGRAQSRTHWADVDVERVHLYNTSWRLLGEKYVHSPVSSELGMHGAAGTYYWEAKRSWASLDHLIVSGRFLGSDLPSLEESAVQVVTLPEFLTGGVPIKFSEDFGKFRGLSDHLPIHARFRI